MSDYSDGRLECGADGLLIHAYYFPLIHWERSGLPTTRSEG
jgi:hypothetical protein